jgi:hypothetical protein
MMDLAVSKETSGEIPSRVGCANKENSSAARAHVNLEVAFQPHGELFVALLSIFIDFARVLILEL